MPAASIIGSDFAPGSAAGPAASSEQPGRPRSQDYWPITSIIVADFSRQAAVLSEHAQPVGGSEDRAEFDESRFGKPVAAAATLLGPRDEFIGEHRGPRRVGQRQREE